MEAASIHLTITTCTIIDHVPLLAVRCILRQLGKFVDRFALVWRRIPIPGKSETGAI
jgi:hypothetical protein